MRNPYRRRAAGLAAGALVATLALAACSGTPNTEPSGSEAASSEGSAPAEAKGALTLAMSQDIEGWDPRVQPGFQNWPASAVWDSLVKCDSTAELEPDIAESWEMLPDNMGMTAKLREGLTFSDGSTLDAEDIQATYEYMAEPESARSADYAGLTYEIIDPLTITLKWDKPQALVNTLLCDIHVQSADYLASGNSLDAPLGSGPYTLDAAKTTTGSVYSFVKRADHWNTDHYPYETLEVKVLDNEAAMVSALKTGQVAGGLVTDQAKAEVEGSGLEVKSFQGQTVRILLTDHQGEVYPAIGDVRVRQAMNMVFDKQAIADSLYLGNAEPTAQVFRKGSTAFIEGLEDPYPYDIEKAKQLMAEAGYADGFKIQLPSLDSNLAHIMPYVIQQLAEINIEAEEVVLSGANAIEDLLSGKFPVILFELGNLGDSTFQIYIESYPDGWWNVSHQPDEYVDSRYLQLATAEPDEAKALEQEINQYIIDEAWQVPLVYKGTHFAFDPEKVSIPTDSDIEALAPKLRDFQ
ncbi:ABC transporter substrate-binding protein [Tessaracoccus sp. MC1627]|uniref:ABC transporter substrate-binding protein n=1 Tax=Tessaracoccus sp. MC1627 TaxID=2760312 RepID=UPI0016033D8D|nr:ABC transporter substrate-binding protein [Tessaracoccus sp. MC1627]MBB1511095.1 ABC transporter substrate-binding protein [Tessaracoccus sp. MC1627]